MLDLFKITILVTLHYEFLELWSATLGRNLHAKFLDILKFCLLKPGIILLHPFLFDQDLPFVLTQTDYVFLYQV